MKEGEREASMVFALRVFTQYSEGFYDDLESPAGPIQAEVRG